MIPHEPFVLHVAVTADDADRLLSTGTVIAGGTDLLIAHRDGRRDPVLVDLSRIVRPGVTLLPGGDLELSATASLSTIGAGIGSHFPALSAALDVFAARTIRNRATLGGNLVTGSPGADTVPPLLAAGAVLGIRSADGRRCCPLASFLLGPRRVDLRPGEWVETVRVPRPPTVGGMRKVAGRRAQAISLVSLAWQWHQDDDGRRREIRLAMGAVAPTVVRLFGVEDLLDGRLIAPDLLEASLALLPDEIRPIDDKRAGAEYRRRCAAGLLREVLGAPPSATTDPPRRTLS